MKSNSVHKVFSSLYENMTLTSKGGFCGEFPRDHFYGASNVNTKITSTYQLQRPVIIVYI